MLLLRTILPLTWIYFTLNVVSMAQLHLGNNVNISTYYGNNTGQSVYVFTKSNQNKIKGIYQDIDQAITNIRNDEAIELSVPRMFSTIYDAVVYITSNSYANCNFLVSVKQGTFFQAEDGIRDWSVTGVQTCALPI